MMTDHSDLVDKVVDVLTPMVMGILRWPDEHWAKRNAQNMAQAVIDALGLRQERRMNEMSSAAMSVDTRTGVTTTHSDIRYDCRFVTDWKVMGE